MTDAANIHSLVDHFFRHESGRLTAVLTRVFGLQNLALVDDVVQAALLQALESWKIHGVPQDPSAWMYRVAKNKALDLIRRRQTADRLGPELAVQYENAQPAAFDQLFLSSEIADSQLRMIFTCCDPQLPQESQIALTLKVLCGFSTEEIGRALLTTEANIRKRIARAKRKFVDGDIRFEVPAGAELEKRAGSVHAVIYLLFNEGYSSSHSQELIRRDLCEEAIRLCLLLLEHGGCRETESAALLALMLFQASRFDARVDLGGGSLLLEVQDRWLWDRSLIAHGIQYLNQSASGSSVSSYHVEAAIAAQHSLAASFAQTDWPAILTLYDDLNRCYPSPVHELNRAIVVAQIYGPDAGLAAIDRIRERRALEDYHLFHATIGELHRRAGRLQQARQAFETALKHTSSASEKKLIERKLQGETHVSHEGNGSRESNLQKH
jgi:RNA polymerase sigma-70 factor (ECF subfamily)